MRQPALVLLFGLGFGLAASDASAAPAETSCPPNAIKIAPGEAIQDAVDKAGMGTTFCLAAGVHRLQRVTPKDGQTFIGEPGAIMSGARLVTSYERFENYWVVKAPKFHRAKSGTCKAQFENCSMPNRLFVDDTPLLPVSRLGQLGPGHSYFDFNGNDILFADDPKDRKLEIAEAVFAFDGGAKDVTIKNLIVEKYDSPAQEGAVNGRRSRNWTFENVEIRSNSAAGIRLGSGSKLRDSNIHHNGQLGVSAGGRTILIENTEIANNNIYGFDDAWEAGGLKSAGIEDFRLVGNRVHNNLGPGLWCDINCRNVVFERNTAENNDGPGIFYEISFDAVIRNNTLRHNGASGFHSFWNSDIQIAASEHVEVFENDIAVNAGGGGIILVDQGRHAEGGWTKIYKTRENYVHHNRIVYEGDGTSGGASDRLYFNENYAIITDGNNRFNFNAYKLPSSASAHFLWGHSKYDWAGFREQGQEHDGSLTSY